MDRSLYLWYCVATLYSNDWILQCLNCKPSRVVEVESSGSLAEIRVPIPKYGTGLRVLESKTQNQDADPPIAIHLCCH